MTTISAKTILRSRNAVQPSKVLSTLLLRYPRWIHAEFMTHRVFSRNAASSRAIPVEKLIQDVIDNPAVPLFWGKNQKGMQASEECKAPVIIYDDRKRVTGWKEPRENAWLLARDRAVELARSFAEAGYHKQIVNRLLEPFAHITVLVSATEWDNFLELRDHPDAEPHIQMLAREIRKCLEDESTIQVLQPGDWHLPFVTEEDKQAVVRDRWDDGEEMRRASSNVPAWRWYGLTDLIKLSVARCASTSYKTVDGFDMTLERAIQLHDKLVSSKPIHASPAEHVAQADDFGGYDLNKWLWSNPHQHGNFVGFRQYRHMLTPEGSLT